MVLASVIAALLVVSVPLICLSSRARARREVQGVVQVGTTEYTLPALVWSLWNFGDPHALAKALSSRGTHSLTGVRDALTTLLQTIPPEQSTAIAALADESERAHSDYLLWQAQREGLSAALGVGAADAFILALGENADWASSILDSITENTEIAEAVLGAVVPKLGRAFFREFTPDLYEAFLEKAAPVLLDSVEAAGDATLEGAALIADTHLPLATIGFALYRAKQASEAGLEGERVAENAAWDIGAKGGGVATGAAIGTFILPGIGTLAGGILGSLLGKGIADRGKARHLNRAQREAAESLTTLGQRVSRHEWLSISRRLEDCVKHEEHSLQTLEKRASSAKSWRWFTRHRGTESLRAALDLGRHIHQRSSADLAAWQQALVASSGPDQAWERGAFLASRPDLLGQMDVPTSLVESALAKQRLVRDERERLKLA